MLATQFRTCFIPKALIHVIVVCVKYARRAGSMNIQAWAGQLVCLFVCPMHSKRLLF